MKKTVIILLALLFVSMVVLSGCTKQQQSTPTPTPTQTPISPELEQTPQELEEASDLEADIEDLNDLASELNEDMLGEIEIDENLFK